MQYSTLNYRYAEQIFESREFQDKKYEIFDIVKRCPDTKLESAKPRGFTTDQRALNRYFDNEFKIRGWEFHPDITGDGKARLQADFKKERVQVEVQFGNMARWYTDVFKMQVSSSLGLIDVGVLIVPTDDYAKTIDSNIACFERIARELPYAKMSITLPILVIGISPKIAGRKRTQ